MKYSTNIIEINVISIQRGNQYYYELLKTIDGGNQPQSLYSTYSCNDYIYQNISVDIWICDEIYKDRCINNENAKCVYFKKDKNCLSKTLCDKVENVSKSSCENEVTSSPSLTKYSYEKSKDIEKCVIKKLCINSLTKEECTSAETINPQVSKWVFDKI